MKLYTLQKSLAKCKIDKRLLGTEIGISVFNYYIVIFIYNNELNKKGKVIGIKFQREGYLIRVITKLKDSRINVIGFINLYKII